MARTGRGKGRGLTLLGLVAGAAIGGTVALFYAPDKGEQNRKHLMEWLEARAGDARASVQRAEPTGQHA